MPDRRRRRRRAAATWPSPTRTRLACSRAQVVANQLARLGDSPVARARPNRSATAAPRAGAPGCGSTWAPTAAPVSTATTAPNWSPICAARSCPTACSTGSTGRGGGPVTQVHVVARRRRRPPRGAAPAGRPRRRTPGGRGRPRARSSGSANGCWRVPVTAFWQAHRDAAARLQRPGAPSGLSRHRRDDGVGSLRRGRGVRRRAGRGGRRRAAGCSPWTPRAARRAAARAALADLPRVAVVTESVRRALHGADRAAPTSRCSTRRAPGPAARSSTCWPRPGCRGWSTSVARQRRSPATSGCTARTATGSSEMRVFDSFPLTHHVECVALLDAA